MRLRRPRPPRRSGAPEVDLDDEQVEALTVAMILAPGVYARNRMFDVLSSPGGRRARLRASRVRGIALQIARANALSVTAEPRGAGTVFVLRYAIAEVRLTRVVELSAVELAALRLVLERSRIRSLPASARYRNFDALMNSPHLRRAA